MENGAKMQVNAVITPIVAILLMDNIFVSAIIFPLFSYIKQVYENLAGLSTIYFIQVYICFFSTIRILSTTETPVNASTATNAPPNNTAGLIRSRNAIPSFN